MFKKLLIALFLLMLPTLASAQTQRNPCYYTGANPQSGSVGCVPVSTTNPLPVTGGGGASTVNPTTASSWGINAQNSATAGQLGQLIMGNVTNAAPSYVSAQTSALSLNANGGLRTEGAVNVTPTDCSGSITTLNVAQNAFAAGATKHGFTIVNLDTAQPLWINFTGTAAASTAGSYPLAPGAATSFAGAGSFTTPPGMAINTALSVVGAASGQKFSCTWW